ncbi:MAG: DNA translocase FtsK [candidate division WOR-3 bacterium]
MKNEVKIIGSLIFIIAVFIFLSILSYLFNPSPDPFQNIGGKIGYFISKYSILYFGKIFPILVNIILLFSGIYLFFNKDYKNYFLKIPIFLFIAFLFSSLLHYFLKILSTDRDIFILFNQFIKGYIGNIFPPIIYIFFIILSIYFIGFKINLPEIKISKKGKTKTKELSEEKETKKRSVKVKEVSESYIEISDFLKEFEDKEEESVIDKKELEENARLIEEKLKEFNIDGKVINISPGPFVTRYDYEPAPGIKISRILSLADDLALRMKSHRIRVVAPLPEKGLVGIEIPNKKQKIVYVKELLNKKEYLESDSNLVFPLGVTTGGEPFYADLRKMPHFLIAGATGSGKTMCINTMLTSLLLRNNHSETRFLLIDPKRVELSFYEGIPHLLKPVVKDRKEAIDILKLAVYWMEERYRHFAKDGVRDIESHNKNVKKLKCFHMPYIVIVIDEFADLMLATGAQVEMPLARLAQMARAVGIHLVVATQRPSVDVITGTIKANFPVRVAFKVPSKVDSRVVLDEIGAEKLLGRGDMLFIPPGSSELIRLHGPYINEEEIKRIVNKVIIDYLNKKLKKIFGENDYTPWINKILDYGLISTLTGGEKTAFDERVELMADYFFDYFPEKEKEKEKTLDKIIEITKNYYPPAPEIEWGMPEETKIKIEEGEIEGEDPLLFEAAKIFALHKQASATLLQRKLKVGFARAARIMDELEKLGIIGPPEGSKPRKVLKTEEEIIEIFKNK